MHTRPWGLRLLKVVAIVVGLEVVAIAGLSLRVNSEAAQSDRRQDATLLTNCLAGNESRENIRGGMHATADAFAEVLVIAVTPPDSQITPPAQARIDAVLSRFDGPLTRLRSYAETFTPRDCSHLGVPPP